MTKTTWDRLASNWEEFKGKVQEEWPILMESDLEEIDGQYDQLIWKLKVRYGMAEEQAERRIGDWLEDLEGELEPA